MYIAPFLTTPFFLITLQLIHTNLINPWVKVLQHLPDQFHLFVFLGLSIEFSMCIIPDLFLSHNLALLKWITIIGFKDSAFWLQLLTCTCIYCYRLDAH